MLGKLQKELKKLENKKRALLLQGYFKTKEGEYGFGDIFIGLTVPQSRQLAIKYKSLTFLEIAALLSSKIHEERLIALLILVHKFKTEPLEQRRIFDFYIKNRKYVNNWDLVDLSSHEIIGEYLIDKPKDILIKFANSQNLWEKRIAVISTFRFIKNKKYSDALKIAEILIEDREDLVQKAVGWMLREIGKKNLEKEEQFLKKNHKKMGRTALRYAIEKFPEKLRLTYLKGEAS